MAIYVNRINMPAGSGVTDKPKPTSTAPESFKTVLENEKSRATEKVDLDPIFSKAAATYGVPEKLLRAVAQAESGNNPNAVSRCGAQGVMQLMPKTAAALGVSDPFDPQQNIMGGAKYLAQMLKKYDGNEVLALAAYNAGPGNVDKYGGIPPFKETRNYVEKINRIMSGDLKTGSDMKTSAAPARPVAAAAASAPRTIQNNYFGENGLLASEPLLILSFDADAADRDTADFLMTMFRLQMQMYLNQHR